jgi:hypothetical protein
MNTILHNLMIRIVIFLFIVTMHHHFVSKGSNSDDVYLNLVLEYVPETVYSISKQYNQLRESVLYTTPVTSSHFSNPYSLRYQYCQ